MYDRFGAVAGGEESDVLWLDGREDKREVGYEWVMDSRVVIFFLKSDSIKVSKTLSGLIVSWREGRKHVRS